MYPILEYNSSIGYFTWEIDYKMDKTTIISMYALSCTIDTTDGVFKSKVDEFISTYYTQVEKNFNTRDADSTKIYAGKIKNRAIYQLLYTQVAHLKHYLSSMNVSTLGISVVNSKPVIPSIDYRVRDNWKLRDNQKAPYNFLVNEPKFSKLLPLATGSGKTAISLFALAALKKRVGILILPIYIDKWLGDITTIHDTTKERIAVVQGSPSLKSLINIALLSRERKELPDYDYYIFSISTIIKFIKSYEEDPDTTIEEYGCAPLELYPLLGIGIGLIDETHQSFHMVFKVTLYTNVEYQIGLSATLLSQDPTVLRAMSAMYPHKSVYADKMQRSYVTLIALQYQVSEPSKRMIKTTAYGSNNYHHPTYENTILKQPYIKLRYLQMILRIIEVYYIDPYRDRDKLLIYVATVKLATLLTDYLSNSDLIVGDKELSIKRYCEEDPYEALIDSDICVSTVHSAGTAVDIPRLRVVLQTVNISSTVTNLQTIGRLRYLEDADVKFIYMYAKNIPKHYEYHKKRLEIFSSRAKTKTELRLTTVL